MTFAHDLEAAHVRHVEGGDDFIGDGKFEIGGAVQDLVGFLLVLGHGDLGLRCSPLATLGKDRGRLFLDHLVDELRHDRLAVHLLQMRDRHLARPEALDLHLALGFGKASRSSANSCPQRRRQPSNSRFSPSASVSVTCMFKPSFPRDCDRSGWPRDWAGLSGVACGIFSFQTPEPDQPAGRLFVFARSSCAAGAAGLDINLVRVERLELPRLTAPEPKSGVSTNFTHTRSWGPQNTACARRP